MDYTSGLDHASSTVVHPRRSKISPVLNGGFRAVRLGADVIPINRVTMGTADAVLTTPMTLLSRKASLSVTRIARYIRADIVRAPGVTSPKLTILHIHGGGFVFGSTRTHRRLAMDLSAIADAEVILFDYRLVPRHSVDEALADVIDAYRWALHRTDPSRLVVSGDSAGGNLMVGLLAGLAVTGLPQPRAAYGLSAWLDPDYRHRRGAPRDPFMSVRFAARAARLSGAGGAIPESALPLRKTVEKFPPVMLQMGAEEPLRGGNEQLAATLRQLGVRAEVQAWKHQPHVFQALSVMLPEGRHALREAAEFMHSADSTP